jgi:leader peptidase (prepilin peptidase) / N-methyltransferase
MAGMIQFAPSPAALAFVVGACFGSFFNVCVARLPSGRSIFRPPSHCFCCGSRVRPWDNIPCLSYLLRRGRCRDCGALFGAWHFAVELAAGAVAALLVARFGPSFAAFFFFSLFGALLVASLIDLEHRIIPDEITLGGAALGLLLPFLPWRAGPELPPRFLDALAGLCLGGGLLYLVAFSYEKLKGREGMGLGDVKLMAMLGALLGWKLVLPILLWSSLIGSVVGLALIVLSRKGRHYPIPFGPFIALGALLSLVWDPLRLL